MRKKQKVWKHKTRAWDNETKRYVDIDIETNHGGKKKGIVASEILGIIEIFILLIFFVALMAVFDVNFAQLAGYIGTLIWDFISWFNPFS